MKNVHKESVTNESKKKEFGQLREDGPRENLEKNINKCPK